MSLWQVLGITDIPRIVFYRSFHVLSFAVLAAFALICATRYKISRSAGAIYALLIYGALFATMYLISWIGIALGFGFRLVSSQVALFVPIPAALLAKKSGLSTLEGCDFTAPALYLARAVGKIGCLIYGCCYGRPWAHGIYSHVQNVKAIPLPLYESISCLLIACITVYAAKRRGYHAGGRAYGISLILLGIVRYLVILATPDVFNDQSITAVVMVLLGLVLLYHAEHPLWKKIS